MPCVFIPVDEGGREEVPALGMMEPPLWRHIPLSNRRTRDLIGMVAGERRMPTPLTKGGQ